MCVCLLSNIKIGTGAEKEESLGDPVWPGSVTPSGTETTASSLGWTPSVLLELGFLQEEGQFRVNVRTGLLAPLFDVSSGPGSGRHLHWVST